MKELPSAVQPGGLNDRHLALVDGVDDVPVGRIDSVTAVAAADLMLAHCSAEWAKDGAGEVFLFPGWVLKF